MTATAPFSVADLLHALGDIPPDRVRMSPLPGTATEDDLTIARKPICELIDGTLVDKPGYCYESILTVEIGSRILNVVHDARLGIVMGTSGLIKIADGLIRAADVTFVPWSSFPNNELPPDAHWAVAPALIVEVLCPANTDAEIDRKLREFFDAKCQLAWVIDPATKTAKVYTSATAFTELTETGTLDGGSVLPGFALVLKDLFAAPQRQ